MAPVIRTITSRELDSASTTGRRGRAALVTRWLAAGGAALGRRRPIRRGRRSGGHRRRGPSPRLRADWTLGMVARAAHLIHLVVSQRSNAGERETRATPPSHTPQ